MIVNIFLIKNLENKIIFFAPFEDLDSFIEVQLKESDLTKETKKLIEDGNTIFSKYNFTSDTTFCTFQNMKIIDMINYKGIPSLNFKYVQKNISPYDLHAVNYKPTSALTFLLVYTKDIDEVIFFENIKNDQSCDIKIPTSKLSLSDISFLLKYDPLFKIEGEYAIFKDIDTNKYLYEKLDSIYIFKEFFNYDF